jgi:signal transduction histidine kinase
MEAGSIPDLILLDLMMPGMNGWQFRVAQRARPALSQVPVIAVSADASAYAAAIDVDAYLQKPIDFDRLLVVIAQVLATSEREQLTQKAIELERLRSLGMLVASVAHEINNPLTYLMGNLDLAEQNMSALDSQANAAALSRLATYVDAARGGAERVAFVVKLLSTFVRADQDDVQSVDPLHAIDAAVRLAILHIRDRAQLVCDLQPLPRVRVNEARLAQVFLNLLMNAAQAIPLGAPSKHEVRIRTGTKGHSAIIEVEDTGVGIPPELKRRIFEPFFTTKPLGAGTGVGLSISHEIIATAGGTLGVISLPGKGSTFRIELPADQETEQIIRPRALYPVDGQPQRVLVVDDDPMMCRLVEAALEDHEVETIVEPMLALQRVSDRPYDLVLSDLKMPDMSGIEFYAELCKRRPDLKQCFVLMTGAAADQELDSFVASNDVTVLRKPFMVNELRQLVARYSRGKLVRR